MKDHYIVVASATIARIYAVHENQWSLVTTLDNPENRMKGSEITTDKPGHYAAGDAHGSFSPHTELKDVETNNFAREVANFLHSALNTNKFDHLTLIAPDHFYGAINQHLNSHVKDAIAKVIQKDYTHMTEKELEAIIGN